MNNDLIYELLSEAVKNKIFPGASIAFVQRDQSTEFISVGNLKYDATLKVDEHTIYDVASITKSIPTSCLALQLIEAGEIFLQDKINKYLPKYNAEYSEETTIWHLLTQTLSFDLKLSSLKHLSGNEILDKIFQARMSNKPGTKSFQVNASSILLSLVIEKVLGSFEESTKVHFFNPMKMQNTGFKPLVNNTAQIAPTEMDANWRGRQIVGEVHDESSWKLQQAGFILGAAGLFSSAYDLSIFVKMILNQGYYQGKSYFQPETIKMMYSNQLNSSSTQKVGLGWELSEHWMGRDVDDNSFGKTGFTGCFVIINAKNKKGLIFLSNAIFPNRPVDRSQLNLLRSKIISNCLNN